MSNQKIDAFMANFKFESLTFDDISLLRCMRDGAEELSLGRTENDMPYHYFGGDAMQHPFSCRPDRHYQQEDSVICYMPRG